MIDRRKAVMDRCQWIGTGIGAVLAAGVACFLWIVAEYPENIVYAAFISFIALSPCFGMIGSTLGFLLTSLPESRRRFWFAALPWGGGGLLVGLLSSSSSGGLPKPARPPWGWPGSPDCSAPWGWSRVCDGPSESCWTRRRMNAPYSGK